MLDYPVFPHTYLKAVVETTNVLSSNSFGKNTRQCARAPKTKAKQDNKEQNLMLSFDQLEGKCCCCGKLGYKLPDCNKRMKFHVLNGQ
jgi:hypothetical protein